MRELGYSRPWLRRVAEEVDAGEPCPKCAGKLYSQPGSEGRLYRCAGCSTLWEAGSLYRAFGERERAARFQKVERQRVEWYAETHGPDGKLTPEAKAQAERDIEELF